MVIHGNIDSRTASGRFAVRGKFAAIALLLCGLLANGVTAADAATVGPRETVIDVSNRMVAALRENKTKVHEDKATAYDLADRIVVPHVDMAYISRLVLGKHWRAASPEQRSHFSDAFKHHLMNTYVTAMVTYTDAILSQADDVRYLPLTDEAAADDDVTVRSEIRLQQGSPAKVGYRMRNDNGEWKIYDLTIDGISLVQTYRNEFSAEIRRQSLDAVIQQLEDRNKQTQ